jgi:hypothetical protein
VRSQREIPLERKIHRQAAGKLQSFMQAAAKINGPNSHTADKAAVHASVLKSAQDEAAIRVGCGIVDRTDQRLIMAR